MSKEIEGKKRELREAEGSLKNKTDELSDLQTKKEQLETGEVGSCNIQEAKTRKSQTLINFILGRVTRVDVDSADMAVSKAERDEKLSLEMMDAVVSSIKTTEAEIQENKTAINMARRRLFETVYDELKAEIQNTIGSRVNAAISIRSRYGVSPADTMSDIFSDSRSISVIDAAIKTVEAEYGIEI